MKKLVLLFVLLCVLASASAAHAVTLQQGWYAKFGFVTVYGSTWAGDHVQEWLSDWTPTSTLVSTGTVQVGPSEPVFKHGRSIAVTEVTDAALGVLFEDAGVFAFDDPYYNKVRFSCETSYDSGKMRLQLWWVRNGYTDQLLWSQMQSGTALGPGSVDIPGNMLPGDSIMFRVAVVPEPTGLLSILSGSIAMILSYVRRRRCVELQ